MQGREAGPEPRTAAGEHGEDPPLASSRLEAIPCEKKAAGQGSIPLPMVSKSILPSSEMSPQRRDFRAFGAAGERSAAEGGTIFI